jgi:hypothetical protein
MESNRAWSAENVYRQPCAVVNTILDLKDKYVLLDSRLEMARRAYEDELLNLLDFLQTKDAVDDEKQAATQYSAKFIQEIFFSKQYQN